MPRLSMEDLQEAASAIAAELKIENPEFSDDYNTLYEQYTRMKEALEAQNANKEEQAEAEEAAEEADEAMAAAKAGVAAKKAATVKKAAVKKSDSPVVAKGAITGRKGKLFRVGDDVSPGLLGCTKKSFDNLVEQGYITIPSK